MNLKLGELLKKLSNQTELDEELAEEIENYFIFFEKDDGTWYPVREILIDKYNKNIRLKWE